MTLWEHIGKINPYWGVLAQPQYLSKNINPFFKDLFFMTGEDDVTRILQRAERHFGKVLKYKRALDFGCGVGRIVVPLAKRFQSVIGVDISRSMLEEARKNCLAYKLDNVQLLYSTEDIKGKVDFVHSMIVFQHIKPKKGLKIIQDLIALLRPSGIGMIHLVFKIHQPPLLEGQTRIPMYKYDLHEVLWLFLENGIKHQYIELMHNEIFTGVLIFFQKPI